MRGWHEPAHARGARQHQSRHRLPGAGRFGREGSSPARGQGRKEQRVRDRGVAWGAAPSAPLWSRSAADLGLRVRAAGVGPGADLPGDLTGASRMSASPATGNSMPLVLAASLRMACRRPRGRRAGRRATGHSPVSQRAAASTREGVLMARVAKAGRLATLVGPRRGGWRGQPTRRDARKDSRSPVMARPERRSRSGRLRTRCALEENPTASLPEIADALVPIRPPWHGSSSVPLPGWRRPMSRASWRPAPKCSLPAPGSASRPGSSVLRRLRGSL